MKRLIVAFRFLTRLPMPRVAGDAADFAAAIRCYPIVGLAVGAGVAAAMWLGAQADPWLGAFAGLVAWVWITGALHLDGLGDLADARGAAHGDRARMLAVLADPHIGSFGVVAIVLQLLAKLLLLHTLPWQAVVLVPFAARIGPIAWARWLPPLKPGLGASVAEAARVRDIAGWLAVLAACAWWQPALLAAPVLMLVWGGWLKCAMGGVNGDCHGAGIELIETGLLGVIVCLG